MERKKYTAVLWKCLDSFVMVYKAKYISHAPKDFLNYYIVIAKRDLEFCGLRHTTYNLLNTLESLAYIALIYYL